MAEVDPENDDVTRYVLFRHGFDPDRHERRWKLVAAYDNRDELVEALAREEADRDRRRARGETVEFSEHNVSEAWEPGHRREHLRRRWAYSALRHGVDPDVIVARIGPLPPNVIILRIPRPTPIGADAVAAVVRAWSDADGWGIIDSPATPGGCFAHYSQLEMDGFRTLHPGQPVHLEWETPGQDGFDYRAVRVRPDNTTGTQPPPS